MPEIPALLLLLAAVSCVVGCSWLALSLDAHWQQLYADRDCRPPAQRLRLMAATALSLALLLCLRASHPTIAVLVWIMLIAGSAFSVAMLLAWRPRWLMRLAR